MFRAHLKKCILLILPQNKIILSNRVLHKSHTHFMILYDSIHINDSEMCTPSPKSVTNIRIIAYLLWIKHSFDTLQYPYDVGNVITLA